MNDPSKNPHSQIPASGEIDETKLSLTDRLGLAWCRLNCGEWDDFLGGKPPQRINRKVMLAIADIIGTANVSRCWFLFVLGKTEKDWLRWYTVSQFLR